MPVKDNERQRDPLVGIHAEEPSHEIPAYLRGRPSRARQTPVRPSERRRRDRQLSVTFSDPEIPDRLRELAHQWGWHAPDKKSPAVSDVVEFLLLPRLEAAEEGRVKPAVTA